MIGDRIAVGVRDSKLSEKMQLEPDLTLAKAVKMVRESENVKHQQAVVRTEQDGNIDLIRAKRFQKGQAHKDESKVPQKSVCQRCGNSSHFQRECKAKSVSSYQKKFPKLFTGLGCIEGDYEIIVDETVSPYNLTAPRGIPIPLLNDVKKELARMESMGVIELVDQPTKWCSPIVVPKKDGSVRICRDFVQLNRAVQREVHPMPSTEETIGKLAGARMVTKLDANCGFWQRKLSEESKLLTTFVTPWGRYCFKRLPFGISSAPEHFQKVMQIILEGLPGQVCQVDDIQSLGRRRSSTMRG